MDLKDPAKRAAGQLAGSVAIAGLCASPAPGGLFTPANDPPRTCGTGAISTRMAAAACGAEQARLARSSSTPRPSRPSPGGWPKGGTTRVELPNRHLEYALTWYGLAAALIIIFAGVCGAPLAPARAREQPTAWRRWG